MLLDLTDDADGDVRVAALCALGRMGRREARQALVGLLRDAPSPAVIDAIPAIADEDCVILLGRIVRTQPGLADAARDALEMIDHPRPADRRGHGGWARRVDGALRCGAFAWQRS